MWDVLEKQFEDALDKKFRLRPELKRLGPFLSDMTFEQKKKLILLCYSDLIGMRDPLSWFLLFALCYYERDEQLRTEIIDAIYFIDTEKFELARGAIRASRQR